MTYREALKARIAAATPHECRWAKRSLKQAKADVELLLAQLERMEAALERKQQLIDRCGEAAFHIFQRAMLPHQRPNRAAIEIECNYIVQQARCVSEWVAAEQKAETLTSLRAVLDAEEK